MRHMRSFCVHGLVPLAFALATSSVHAELINYYVAIDSADGEPLWSAYNDQDGDGIPETVLPNPNQDRLTFLYAHSEEDPTTNHFHTIGRYAYTGDLASPSVTDKNEYNFWSEGELLNLPGHFIPEQFAEAGEPVQPLPLLQSSGIFDGMLTSIPGGESGRPFGNMEIRPTADLVPFAPGTPEHYMLRSLEPFGEEYDEPLLGAEIGIELLDLTPGLGIGSLANLSILTNPGDTFFIGSGDDNFSFTPVFWTEADAPGGVYSATMRIVDLRTSGEAFLPSGQFTVSFSVVPEPSTLLLVGVSVIGLVGASRRRQR